MEIAARAPPGPRGRRTPQAPPPARPAARLASEASLDAGDGFFGVGARAECRQPEVTLAARPEPRAGRPDDVRLAQELVEEIPRRLAGGHLDPDVGRVAAAVDGEAGALQAATDDLRVLHVEVDQAPYLALSLVRVDGGGGLLDDVRHAVELRRLPAEP